MNKVLLAILTSLLHITCNGQILKQNNILYGSLENFTFIGYINEYPVFYNTNDDSGLYVLSDQGKDSLKMKKIRESQLGIQRKGLQLLWVNNEIEVYTMSKPKHMLSKNFIIVRDAKIDTIQIALNSYYQSNYCPFVITSDRKTLFAVQPEGYQDDNLEWYYDSIMKIDLTKKALTVEKLPITGIEMQIVGNYLYYKGGSGECENAILRAEINKWSTVDTLVKHAYYWYVEQDILYAEIGRYKNQDKWFNNNSFIAYSIPQKQCAIVSKDRPRYSDMQPIMYKNQFYNFWNGGLYKLDSPKITEFPYKQTIVK